MIPVERRKTVAVNIDGVVIGGTAPVVVQSMTNTDTADVNGTVTQIRQLADAGSELVRVTVNNDNAARAVPEIVSQLRESGYPTPIVGDFHYNGHLLLKKFPET
ncbi:MAG TPA: 4-hydroxy-3-methylbut-2-en-1-yl diphosphate synthase, partial [Gemmatimonadetes bacterium]|nr:4-hydroxy-3-methylbut-2-en-1-yl diphosphate synthase [Gemmatimonadota bacterium]